MELESARRGSQQRFFAALSVFRGGSTADAIEAVCGATDARSQLEALVADSLLRAEADASDVMRFSMLETLREFLQERIGDETRALRARHRDYFLKLAREAAAADTTIAGAGRSQSEAGARHGGGR